MKSRGAIGTHHTAVSTKSWDGPGNEAKLSNDAGASTYKKMYAWVDPDKDPDTKSAYKFPHHEVSATGSVGAANMKGCQSGIGVLNGAMGGSKIPSGDKKGVYNHLAAHLKDGDLEPAPLRSSNLEPERRYFPTEIRLSERDGGLGIISGLGVVYNQWSDDLGGFIEMVKPGAGLRSMDENDIFSTYNHNDDYILGRISAGTLRLSVDQKGITYEADLPDTTYANDLKVSIGRGDVRGSSFRFRVTDDNWGEIDGKQYREILDFDLFEMGPVTNPAYPQTTAGVRTFQELGINYNALHMAILKTQTNNQEQRDLDVIASAIEALCRYLPPDRVDPDGAVDEGLVDQVLRLRLKLL